MWLLLLCILFCIIEEIFLIWKSFCFLFYVHWFITNRTKGIPIPGYVNVSFFFAWNFFIDLKIICLFCSLIYNKIGKNYFLSSHVPGLAGKKVDWLDGRNLCREYCMDLVSLENQEKNNLIFRLIQTNDVPYIWTSGRLCDFKGCENRYVLWYIYWKVQDVTKNLTNWLLFFN